jgi:hypothetical protein
LLGAIAINCLGLARLVLSVFVARFCNWRCFGWLALFLDCWWLTPDLLGFLVHPAFAASYIAHHSSPAEKDPPEAFQRFDCLN